VSGISTSDGEPLTISFGVVDFPRDGATAQDLMDAADGALYAAKAAGRDRTITRSEPEPATA
jgi:GGDEF domain-containing protein